MPPSPENHEQEPRLKTTWEAAAYDREKGDWVHTQLHSYEHPQGDVDIEELLIRQGPSIRIASSKRKPVQRDYELIAFIPDEQIGYRDIDGELVPTHDEAAMNAARLLLRFLQPDYVYANGDGLDLPNFSKYPKDSRHFTPRTIQASIDRATQWNAELTEATPNAQRVRMSGNHDIRLSSYILRNAEEVYGIRRGSLTGEHVGDPLLTIANLTRAEELGWTHVSEYPGEFVHKDDLVIVHGNKVNSSGSTAATMSKLYPDRNVVFGHVHRRELHTRTHWTGKTVTAASFGTLARTDGMVPSYHSAVNEVTDQPRKVQENWAQGIGLVEDYGNGEYNFIFIAITKGVLSYQGKEYGTE